MAITNAFPTQSKLDALKAEMPAANVYKAVLLAPGATFDASATVYDGTGEVANGNGYTTGGQTLTGYAATVDGTTAVLDFADPTWPNSTISAAGMLIVDTTNGNKIRGVFSFGQTVSSSGASFTAQLPAPTAATAVIRI